MVAKNVCLQIPYPLCSTPRYFSDCSSFSKQSVKFQETHLSPHLRATLVKVLGGLRPSRNILKNL